MEQVYGKFVLERGLLPMCTAVRGEDKTVRASLETADSRIWSRPADCIDTTIQYSFLFSETYWCKMLIRAFFSTFICLIIY